MVEEDKISFEYKNAGCEIIRVSDALAYVEAMEVANIQPFDVIFIDADKTRFLQYVEASLKLLKKGGLMLVDNVLWKGVVLDVNNGTLEVRADEEDPKRSRRARKLANAVHSFNSAIVNDSRVEVVLLNVRDGLSIIRKK